MTENRLFISSAELIPEIYSDYNIKSDDFINRFPIWIVNALEELKIYQSYVTNEKELPLTNGKVELPYDFKGIIDVYTDDKKLKLATSNKDIESNDYKYSYYIQNNWLYTSSDFENIKITYRSFPFVEDEVLGMYVPLIYDIGLLKRYLKLYIIRNMLIRGYKHSILNLTVNNPVINPGLELMQIKTQVRTACNKFNKDRRENIAEILSKTFIL